MTLEKMKRAILSDYTWNRQRGPGDSVGYSADAQKSYEIRKAKTWGELHDAAPPEWKDRVAAYSRPETEAPGAEYTTHLAPYREPTGSAEENEMSATRTLLADLTDAINDYGSDAAADYWHGSAQEFVEEAMRRAERDGVKATVAWLDEYVADND